MKQTWQNFAAKIDALGVRERAMVFTAALALLVFLIFLSLLDPLYARQKKLIGDIRQQQNQIAGIDAEVAQKIAARVEDPDAASKEHLKKIRAELVSMHGELRTMQNKLVAPDKIVVLLESILKGNRKLRLESLKTLPASGMTDGRFSDTAPAEAPEDGGLESKLAQLKAQAGAAPAPAAAAASAVIEPKAKQLLFRHGVEIVLEGSYLDMLSYMEALEAMPAQLFWGKANLVADAYPAARLTLTLYTMSLDPTWIAL